MLSWVNLLWVDHRGPTSLLALSIRTRCWQHRSWSEHMRFGQEATTCCCKLSRLVWGRQISQVVTTCTRCKVRNSWSRTFVVPSGRSKAAATFLGPDLGHYFGFPGCSIPPEGPSPPRPEVGGRVDVYEVVARVRPFDGRCKRCESRNQLIAIPSHPRERYQGGQ